ncbi:MAG: ABC transporter permease [Clostridium sp.]|nr:ABC transporter permease [Clostridium sp.]
MDNLGVLLKIAFYNIIGINSLSKNIKEGKEKKKLIFTFFMIVFVGVIIATMSSIYSYGLAQVLNPIGELKLLLLFAILISSILIVFTYIYKAPDILFSSKDYELLSSLPIKNSTILCSKLMEMMIINYVYTALIMIPVSIVYFITSGNNSWTFFLVAIIGLIFIPMIPVVIASIIAIIIYYISSKFRHKNVISIIIDLIATMLILYGSIKMNNIIDYFVYNSTSISNGIGKIYPPAQYLAQAMVNFDLVSLFKFIIVSVIPFAIFIGVFSKIFSNINKILGENYRKADYKLKDLKTSSQLAALIKGELRLYFSIRIYVMNTIVGIIIVLAVAALSLFNGKEFIQAILEQPNISEMFDLSKLSTLISCGTLIITVFGLGLACTTISSISLEGENLWIKKSLPISENYIFKAKIISNLILTIPTAIISNILFYIALKFDFIYLILNMVITILFSILSAVLGILINIYFPKLDWSNPTVVVKQSAAVFIGLIVTFASIALPIVAFLALKIENIFMFLNIISVILLCMVLISWNILMTKGIKQFNML